MKKSDYEKTKYPNIFKHKTNGTYAIDISLGYDSRGKRIRTTRSGIKKEKEAREILQNIKLKKDIKQGITEKAKFEDLLEEYYSWLVFGKKIKETTLKRKKSRFNSRILPFFKGMKLINIKRTDIEAYHKYLDKATKEHHSKKGIIKTDIPLDSETKNSIHKTLSAYFNWIITYKGAITNNPCKSVSNFKVEKKDIEYYTLDELMVLLDTIDKDTTKEKHTKLLVKAVIEGLFFSGFRLGEFLGLRFSDIDFDLFDKKNIDKDEIKINIKAPITYDSGWIETTGKTFDSIRVKYLGRNSFIPIFKYVKYWMAYGIKYSKDDYIFTSPISGKIISPTQLRGHINYYMDKAGLKRLKLKDFRHSYATLLMSNGYRLEDIKEELGHTSIKITEKHYATLYEENKKNIAKKIDKLL